MGDLKNRLINYPPLVLALFCASLLFFSNSWSLFTVLSVNSDNHLWGYDYFGLPRCGLALLRGIPIAGSEKVIAYGPWSTDWASHPAMCFVLGIPLSQFENPRISYTVANVLYYFIHIYALTSLSHALCDGSFKTLNTGQKLIHYVFAFLVGYFAPFVIIYHYAQYHALSILALTLVLKRHQKLATGFILSALTKPFLAPAGLLLFVQRQWSLIWKIILGAAFGTLPWYVVDLLNQGQSMNTLGDSGLSKLFYTVPHWEQEQSIAKALETLVSPQTNIILRLLLCALQIASAIWLTRRGDLRTGIGIASLVFFTLYARGHEYHAVTLIPFFVYLFAEKQQSYRNWTFITIVAMFALPTTYPILFYGLGSGRESILAFKNASPVLGWAFVLQRPLAVISLWLYVVVREIRTYKFQEHVGMESHPAHSPSR